MNKTYVFLAFVVLAGALVAQNSILSGTTVAIKELCRGVKDLLPVAAMLMIVLAGVIYAAGQIMGAETRARANVWATACLTGALIAVLIAAIAPPMLTAIYGQSGVSGINVGVCDN
ncbi:Uncharacterised protein [Candidatus Anstonella stagnisolia]|nr:Uncharacterised protein [Candidatus Anstonella stagnisolia]